MGGQGAQTLLSPNSERAGSRTQVLHGAPNSLVQAQDGALESDLREGRQETRDRDLSEVSHRKEEERKVVRNLRVISVTF